MSPNRVTDYGKDKGRELKRRVLTLLTAKDFDGGLIELSGLPPRRVINPLLSFLMYHDELVCRRAVTAIGALVGRLADTDMEGARVIVRRLMWSLNDESGGVGWGAPEAMGEIIARHPGLAAEYSPILVSYMHEDGNFLEYEPLRRGLMWGLARAVETRSPLLRDAVRYLPPYLDAVDPSTRFSAAVAAGLLGAEQCSERLGRLRDDETEVRVYRDGVFTYLKVRDAAEEALAGLDRQKADDLTLGD
ncbi:MAG: HEAT repeat domain-containing protein [Pseudomonadota bacterium]